MLSCSYLKNHRVISPDGTILPCCRFQVGDQREKFFNIHRSGLEEALRSQGFREVARKLAEGSFAEGCSACQIEEENGILSMRMKASEIPSPLEQITSLEFYLGNSCNMKCRTCGPTYSSRWEQEILSNGGKIYKEAPIDVLYHLKNNDISSLQYLRLLGGEPFYIKMFYEILDYLIDAELAQQIYLDLSTNVSVFPNQEVLKELSRFKKVDMSLSIDDVGVRAEYLRTGTDWALVSRNLSLWLEFRAQTLNFNFSVHITISAYNVLHVDSVILAILDVGWKDISMTFLKEPTELSPLRIPFEKRKKAWVRMEPLLRGKIAEKLCLQIEKILSIPEELSFDEFYKYNERIDSRRGESIENYWANSV